MSQASGPEASARAALDFVEDGMTLGLGTGRAAAAFVRALGARVAEGLGVRGVPTSLATEALAREVGIPLLTLEEAGQLDATFDGADEVDPHLDVIKGYGGALVREKIVAASSDRFYVLVGEEKLVARLGERGKLPVEVVPFARPLVQRRMVELGCKGIERLDASGAPVRTDNGNLILDAEIGPIEDAAALDLALLSIPGVLGTGLFVGMTDAVVVQRSDRVDVLRRS